MSPRRLNLRLYCLSKTPVKDRLDVWPALPLVIEGDMNTDIIITALGQSNRVRHAILGLAGCQSLAPMQVPFPELTDLCLRTDDGTQPVISDSFLGGSAPRLRTLKSFSISFPGLPKLLLSATRLVHLLLYDIPDSGYISPKTMVALLSVLSNLKTLFLGFESPQYHPDSESRSLPLPKRSILPALNEIRFIGVTEYLEEFVTLIDVPQLNQMDATFFDDIGFDCPRLAHFINCTPKLRERDEAHVDFEDSTAGVSFRSRISKSKRYNLLIHISCEDPDRRLSSIKRVCNSSLYPLSTVEVLYIEYQYQPIVWKNDPIKNTTWLELLLPFTAVKNLTLSEEFAPSVAAALEELVGDRITEVLPNLQDIFVEDPSGDFPESIGRFVAARQLSDHPITVSDWDIEKDWGCDGSSSESSRLM